MEKLNLNKANLRKFGITMGAAFFIIALLVFFKHKQGILFPVISLIFFLFTVISPALLKPVYVIWMRFAFLLAWINTRIILLAIFYLIFTPFSLVIRLLGKDLLGRKIQKNSSSYWLKKESIVFNPVDYERRF